MHHTYTCIYSYIRVGGIEVGRRTAVCQVCLYLYLYLYLSLSLSLDRRVNYAL
jgi:hypothetical protein